MRVILFKHVVLVKYASGAQVMVTQECWKIVQDNRKVVQYFLNNGMRLEEGSPKMWPPIILKILNGP